MKHLLLISFLLLASSYSSAEEEPNIETPRSKYAIEYPTPAAALESLRAKKDVTVTEEKEWIIVQDLSVGAIWTFTTANNAAHPSVVKRVIYEENKGINLYMDVLCGAKKRVCDDLTDSFLQLNEQMKKEFSK